MVKKYSHREQWLNEAVLLLRPEFKAIDAAIPKNLRVSCGFPSKNALGTRKRRIGECWADSASAGKNFEIFISPVLYLPVQNLEEKKSGVLDTLTHEVIHAIAGIDAGHKAPFKKVALGIGLAGKMTATHAGEELEAKLKKLARTLGDYPHDALSGMTNGKQKQGTRLIKATCDGCEMVIRTTMKWIDEIGLPNCACGGSFATESGEDD